MKVIFLLLLSEMSEMLKVKFILYILNEMFLEFWEELINIFERVRNFLEVKRKITNKVSIIINKHFE